MRQGLHKTLLLLSSVFTASCYAESNSADCVSILSSPKNILELSEAGEWRKTTGTDVTFDYSDGQSYAEYLEYAQTKITNRNPKANLPCPIKSSLTPKQLGIKSLATQTVGDLVKPFQIEPPVKSDRAILLVHGLTDSPYLFHDLSAHFLEQGLTVRTLLLPGHGTAPSDLLDVEYEQWLKATRYAIKRTTEDFERVYIGGYSTGGAAIVDQLLHGGFESTTLSKVNGVFLWAPAFQAQSDIAWLAKYVDLVPFVDWVDKRADVDFAKYESFPFNAAAQVNDLMTQVSSSNQPLPNIPLFVVASEVDSTIETKRTVALLSKWHQQESRTTAAQNDTLFYFGSKASLPTRGPVTNNLVMNCETHACPQNVLDVSHNSATGAPHNPHYGLNGTYRNCEHYSELEAFRECKLGHEVLFGENHSTGEGQPIKVRLTYNPFFDEMTQAISSFIKHTSK